MDKNCNITFPYFTVSDGSDFVVNLYVIVEIDGLRQASKQKMVPIKILFFVPSSCLPVIAVVMIATSLSACSRIIKRNHRPNYTEHIRDLQLSTFAHHKHKHKRENHDEKSRKKTCCYSEAKITDLAILIAVSVD